MILKFRYDGLYEDLPPGGISAAVFVTQCVKGKTAHSEVSLGLSSIGIE